MASDAKQNLITQFSRHVPHILRQQLLYDLVDQYLSDRNIVNGENKCRPSIQRFHGALLFVDISGFTALSLKLDVESLKNHINDYFTKMLEIVDKWGGDVVKFAGDALYIIWQTDIHSISTVSKKDEVLRSANVKLDQPANSRLASASKLTLEKAIACGIEITSTCGHHPINISGPKEESKSGVFGNILPSFNFSFLSSATKVNPAPSSDDSKDIVYLDVHAGVSYGLMAGVDIGYNDRWEYFLVGDPLTRVSEAEGQAKKGEIVICKQSHALIHPKYTDNVLKPVPEEILSFNMSSRDKKASNSRIQLPCGCCKTSDGLYQISTLDVTQTVQMPKPNALRKSRSKSKLEESSFLNEMNAQNIKLYDDIVKDCENVISQSQSRFKDVFVKYKSSFANYLVQSESKIDQNSGFSNNDSPTDHENSFIIFCNSYLKKHLIDWTLSFLMDDIARHVHEVARDNYSFNYTVRNGGFNDFLGTLPDDLNQLQNTSDEPLVTPAKKKPSVNLRSSISHPRTTESISEIDDEELDSKVKTKATQLVKKRSYNRHITQEAVGNAELRTVTVMFVKIDSFDLSLLVDDNQPRNFRKVHNQFYKSFRFLDRTDNEITSDNLLLNRIQSCFEILGSAFSSNGGQIRQFIVDDKGTVCIGTFGLRGSMSLDNSAVALETAKNIIIGLKSLDLTASIGITVGKAYCGLVGSSMRHEYAVMGPSTNLSARLMGKAPPDGVICDYETKIRDRAHLFETLKEVKAKGYSEPVMTFKPIFDDLPNFDQNTYIDDFFNPAVDLLDDTPVVQPIQQNHFEFDVNTKSFIITDNENQNSINKVIQKIISSDFFVMSPNTNNNVSNKVNHKHKHRQKNSFSTHSSATAQMKLFGRQLEIMQIFNILFYEENSFADHLSYDQPAKMVAVCGSEGTGKTALLTSVSRKMYSLSKNDTRFNLLVLQHRSSSLLSNIPLKAWKSILTELLRSIFQVKCRTSADDGSSSRSFHFSTRKQFNSAYINGLDVLFAMMPENFQQFKNLVINTLDIGNETEDEATSRLDPKSKIKKCCELTVQLISAAASLLNRRIFFVLEEIQCFDPWSLVVLHMLWNRGKGISILVSYSTLHGKEIPSWSIDTVEFSRSIDGINTASKFEFFKRFNDLNRFNCIILHPLDKESTISLAKAAYGAENLVLDPNQVFEASGGNPLYAVELVKSVQKKNIASNAAQNINSNTKLNHRIEEVICFRLDKLDFSLQIILKAAAVAASHNRTFSLQLVTYILINEKSESRRMSNSYAVENSVHSSFHSDDPSLPLFPENMVNDSETNFSVSEALLYLLKTGEFLQISTDDKDFIPDNLTKEMIRDSWFEFQIPLEQATIYGLLVDEQKNYFHERVASYYLQNVIKTKKKNRIDTALPDNFNAIPVLDSHFNSIVSQLIIDRLEEAFHWERSFLWSRAIRAYMHAAKLAKVVAPNDPLYIDYLNLAYNSFQSMERETNILPPGYFLSSLQDELLFKMLNLDDMSECATNPDYSTVRERLASMFEVFEADLDVLPFVIILHLTLLNIHMQVLEEPHVILHLANVCMDLLLFYQIRHNKSLANISFASHFNAQSTTIDDAPHVIYRAETSSIRQHHILNFLSNYLYVHCYLAEDPNYYGESSHYIANADILYTIQQFYLRECPQFFMDGDKTEHSLQCLCANIYYQYQTGQHKLALQNAELLLTDYNEFSHISLVESYGSNYCFTVWSWACQYILLKGDLTQNNNDRPLIHLFLDRIVTCIVNTSSKNLTSTILESLFSQFLLRLLSVLFMTRRFEDMNRIWTLYLQFSENQASYFSRMFTFDDLSTISGWINDMRRFYGGITADDMKDNGIDSNVIIKRLLSPRNGLVSPNDPFDSSFNRSNSLIGSGILSDPSSKSNHYQNLEGTISPPVGNSVTSLRSSRDKNLPPVNTVYYYTKQGSCLQSIQLQSSLYTLLSTNCDELVNCSFSLIENCISLFKEIFSRFPSFQQHAEVGIHDGIHIPINYFIITLAFNYFSPLLMLVQHFVIRTVKNSTRSSIASMNKYMQQANNSTASVPSDEAENKAPPNTDNSNKTDNLPTITDLRPLIDYLSNVFLKQVTLDDSEPSLTLSLLGAIKVFFINELYAYPLIISYLITHILDHCNLSDKEAEVYHDYDNIYKQCLHMMHRRQPLIRQPTVVKVAYHDFNEENVVHAIMNQIIRLHHHNS